MSDQQIIYSVDDLPVADAVYSPADGWTVQHVDGRRVRVTTRAEAWERLRQMVDDAGDYVYDREPEPEQGSPGRPWSGVRSNLDDDPAGVS